MSKFVEFLTVHLVPLLSVKRQLSQAGTVSDTFDPVLWIIFGRKALLCCLPQVILLVEESEDIGFEAGINLYPLYNLNIFDPQNVNIFTFHFSFSQRL